MQSPLNITISASIQTPAFPQCSAANCSLHTVFFSAGTRDSKRCPQDSCKRDAGTGPVHTHTLTNTSAKRTAAGHDLRSAHAYMQTYSLSLPQPCSLLSLTLSEAQAPSKSGSKLVSTAKAITRQGQFI